MTLTQADRNPVEIALKGCPICGSAPRGCDYVGDEDGGYWAIECVAPGVHHFAGVHGDTKAGTIAEWNTRQALLENNHGE